MTEPPNLDTIRDRCKRALASAYGLYSVYQLKIASVKSEGEFYLANGTFSEDWEETEKHTFEIKLDKYYRVTNISIT